MCLKTNQVNKDESYMIHYIYNDMQACIHLAFMIKQHSIYILLVRILILIRLVCTYHVYYLNLCSVMCYIVLIYSRYFFTAHAWGNLFITFVLDRHSNNQSIDLDLCGSNFCPYVAKAGANIEQPSISQVNGVL